MILEIIKWITIIFAIPGPLIYIWFWKPYVTNKSMEYFSVRHVERNSLTISKYLIIFGTLEIFWICAEDYNTSKSWSWVVAAFVLSFPIWIPTIICHCRKRFYCLPIRKGFDMCEIIESIENEPFTQIRPEIWYSKNWIRLSNRFFPKNAISKIEYCRSHYKHQHIWVELVMTTGKTYSPYKCSVYDKTIHADIEELKEQLFNIKKI